MLDDLRRQFRPEFLNRIDDVVLFKPLRLAEIERIVDLQTEELRRRLEALGVTLVLTPEARSYVAREGFDPTYGARPLKRYLQRHLESRIARALIGGEAPAGTIVEVGIGEAGPSIALKQPTVPTTSSTA